MSEHQRILVTGGAGYTGIPLVARLLADGHRVTLLDNFLYGHDPILHLLSEPCLSVAPLDVRNLTEQAVAGHDVIFHLAGLSGILACTANPHAATAINVDATRRLVSLLSRNQLLVYASTTSVYGAAGSECDETTPTQPGSLYARTKLEAEQIVMAHGNAISLRFATIFGPSPRMRNDLLVNDFTYRALHERALVLFASRSQRTFLHLQDAVGAYAFALQHADKMRGEVFNVGGAALNYSKLQIAEAIAGHVPCEIFDTALEDPDVRNFLTSFDRIRALGYVPQRTLDDGIRDLLRLYAFYRVVSHHAVI